MLGDSVCVPSAELRVPEFLRLAVAERPHFVAFGRSGLANRIVQARITSSETRTNRPARTPPRWPVPSPHSLSRSSTRVQTAHRRVAPRPNQRAGQAYEHTNARILRPRFGSLREPTRQ